MLFKPGFKLTLKMIMRPSKILFILYAAIFILTSVSTKAQVKITDGAVLTLNPNSLLQIKDCLFHG